MCGGFIEDIVDGIGDAIEDVGDFIGDTVEAVVENPLGAIVSVGSMALGVPPVWAGALGGAANAAANDGNILEGALLGGATGYVGGLAGQAAAGAGYGNIAAGAAGGAAAGAAGAALTGQNIIRGALMGGTLGAGTGALYDLYQDVNGNKVYKYDDGSTITRDGNGNAISSTPATDGTQAPVMEYNPSTGRIETFNPDGTLNILSVEETNALMAKIDPNLRNSLVDTGEVFRVEVEGLPGTAENASYAKSEFRTPGTELATFEQIDAGQATWNPAANAWEVGAPAGPAVPVDESIGAVNMGGGTSAYTGPEVYTFDDGSTFTMNPDGTTSFTEATTGATHSVGGGSVVGGGAGGATYTFDDGTWLTINPDGSSVWTDTDGATHTSAGGTYTGSGSGGQPTDLGEITITAPREPTTDLGEIDITAPRIPGDGTVVGPTPGVVTPDTPVTPGPGGDGGWTTPVTPVFPVITPPGGGGGGGTPTTPGTPVGPAPTSTLQTNWGLNPGWIAPTPFYNTTSPVQSQFYWGSHPFQAGPAFNAQLYNQAFAPQTPWGAQQMAQPLTPDEMVAASRGQYQYQPQGAPAVRASQYVPQQVIRNNAPATMVAAPVAPTATAVSTPAPVYSATPVIGPTAPVQFVVGPA